MSMVPPLAPVAQRMPPAGIGYKGDIGRVLLCIETWMIEVHREGLQWVYLPAELFKGCSASLVETMLDGFTEEGFHVEVDTFQDGFPRGVKISWDDDLDRPSALSR